MVRLPELFRSLQSKLNIWLNCEIAPGIFERSIFVSLIAAGVPALYSQVLTKIGYYISLKRCDKLNLENSVALIHCSLIEFVLQ